MKCRYVTVLLITALLLGCSAKNPGDSKKSPPPDLEIVSPAKIGYNRTLPIIAKFPDWNPRIDMTVSYPLASGQGFLQPAAITLKRGRGSVSIALSFPGDAIIAVSSGFGQEIAEVKTLVDVDSPRRALSGTLTGESLLWDSTAIIYLIDDVTLPVGETLIINPGTIIEIDKNVRIVAEGGIDCRGTKEYPVLFTSRNQNEPWGQIAHLNSSGIYHYTIITCGGGDNIHQFGHSYSQPVIYGEHCEMTLENVYFIDNPGKAMGILRGEVNMRNSLVSCCDTGGEFHQTRVEFSDCYFIDMPNGDGIEVDDDNDALYLLAPWIGGEEPSLLTQCVFVTGKDDAIDHNNARVRVEGCVIDGFHNEGVAASNDNIIEIINTLVLNCEQGIEAGYGAPQVIVDHCTLIGNETGLRFGDWYHDNCTGTLNVMNTISHNNTLFNVYYYDLSISGPRDNSVFIEYSIVNLPEYDSGEGCLVGNPEFDCDYQLQQGSIGWGAASDSLNMGILPFP